ERTRDLQAVGRSRLFAPGRAGRRGLRGPGARRLRGCRGERGGRGVPHSAARRGPGALRRREGRRQLRVHRERPQAAAGARGGARGRGARGRGRDLAGAHEERPRRPRHRWDQRGGWPRGGDPHRGLPVGPGGLPAARGLLRGGRRGGGALRARVAGEQLADAANPYRGGVERGGDGVDDVHDHLRRHRPGEPGPRLADGKRLRPLVGAGRHPPALARRLYAGSPSPLPAPERPEPRRRGGARARFAHRARTGAARALQRRARGLRRRHGGHHRLCRPHGPAHSEEARGPGPRRPAARLRDDRRGHGRARRPRRKDALRPHRDTLRHRHRRRRRALLYLPALQDPQDM
ncbi:MAG: ABC-type Fe3+-siderophore transport system, permease 2 component, partial [uncultured Rubrobacteraceae bacterium]